MMADEEEYIEEYTPRVFHLRYGIIVTDHKHCRFIIARVDTEDYPLVFFREWEDDPEEGYGEYYSLYRDALTASEADEILELLKKDEKRRANALLRRYFKPGGVICEFVGEIRLDDAVPDAWYDVWKEMEGPITFLRDCPGYYEADVEERGLW